MSTSKIKFVLPLVLFGLTTIAPLFSVGSTQAATGAQSINVSMTVPSSGGSSGRGGGSPSPAPVDNPPSISAVNYNTTQTGAIVAWSATDDNGIKTSWFDYGLTTSYGKSGTISGSYQASLTGLTTSTLYYFKISVTDTANQTSIYTGSFKTSAGPVAALPLISKVKVVVGITSVTISWSSDIPTIGEVDYGSTADYGKKIIGTTVGSNHQTEYAIATDARGFTLAAVPTTDHLITIQGLLPGTLYHYRIILTDSDGNSQTTSDATFTTLKESLPPPDVSQLQATVVGQSIILNWVNPTDTASPDFKEVKIVKKIGSRPTSLDDGTVIYTGTEEEVVDKEVLPNVNYYYSIFSVDTSGNTSAGTFVSGEVPPKVGQEICSNKVDDDHNGFTDCDDSACARASACLPATPIPETPRIETPGNPGAATTTVSSSLKITLDQVLFLAANRTLRLTVEGNTVTNLNGFNFSIALPQNLFKQMPISIVVAIGGQDIHQLRYNDSEQRYISDLVFPPPGTYPSYITIDYGNDQIDSISFVLASLPWGQVQGDNNPLPGVTVKLFHEDGTPVSTESYGQNSQFTTTGNGQYGWVIPKGKYYAKFYLSGYYEFSTPLFDVENNIFNASIQLVAKPKKLSEVIDFDKSLGENLKNISKNLAAKTKATLQLLQNLSDNPEVEKAAETVVAPAAVSVVAASSGFLIPWGDLLPLLRLLFLQPLLLIGKRKREGWGQVYHSLTKLPVDLAIVRLVDGTTGKVVQSRVTDKNGRYYFTTNPGKYRLEVVKDKMSFPSNLLKNFTEDGSRTDIYHGEIVIVNDTYPAITANVPLDPAGESKAPRRLRLEKIGRRIQSLLSSLGLIATAISFYISPKWYVGALLVGHLGITFVFRRLALPPKPKSWGIVYDVANKKPIGRTIARLFSAQFNKLISTQITDGKGRYYFLAGDNRFYVTYDHKDYLPTKTNEIDLSGKEIDTIRNSIGLTKKSLTNPNQAE